MHRSIRTFTIAAIALLTVIAACSGDDSAPASLAGSPAPKVTEATALSAVADADLPEAADVLANDPDRTEAALTNATVVYVPGSTKPVWFTFGCQMSAQPITVSIDPTARADDPLSAILIGIARTVTAEVVIDGPHVVVYPIEGGSADAVVNDAATILSTVDDLCDGQLAVEEIKATVETAPPVPEAVAQNPVGECQLSSVLPKDGPAQTIIVLPDAYDFSDIESDNLGTADQTRPEVQLLLLIRGQAREVEIIGLRTVGITLQNNRPDRLQLESWLDSLGICR